MTSCTTWNINRSAQCSCHIYKLVTDDDDEEPGTQPCQIRSSRKAIYPLQLFHRVFSCICSSTPSHHQKLGVIRSLLDRKEAIVTEDEDKKKEDTIICDALHQCGYPAWAIDKSEKRQTKMPTEKRIDKKSRRQV